MRQGHLPVGGRDLLCWTLFALLLLLQLATWAGGGVTEDASAVDEWLQLLALPLLAVAFAALLLDPPRDRLARVGICAMLLIACVPALQLLPLPAGSWAGSGARASLALDLEQAGVDDLQHRWSLSPLASEQGLWFLLPGLAAFFAGLALPSRFRRWILLATVAPILLNIPFAFQQEGLPPDSESRLFVYPDGSAAFGGLFINHNHHATALVVGMVLAVALAVDGWRRRSGHSPVPLYLLHAALALGFLLAIPFTSSRAGALLAPAMLALALLMTGAVPVARILRSRRGRVLVAGALAFGFLAAWWALRWLAAIKSHDPRFAVADASFAMIPAYAPWGSGIGSFVQAFVQNAPNLLLEPAYANHAHNEYAEWWLTGGIAALLASTVALAVLAVAGARIWRLRGVGGSAVFAGACWTAIVAMLLHSWVDFPLRTTTLMTMACLLGGLMLACITDAGNRRRRRVRQRVEENG